jgi:hypothetical protein
MRKQRKEVCIDMPRTAALELLFNGPHAAHLVFKGGTSLSKADGVIRVGTGDVPPSVMPEFGARPAALYDVAVRRVTAWRATGRSSASGGYVWGYLSDSVE